MRSLIRVLVQFNYDKKAKELQHTYDSFYHWLTSLIPKMLEQLCKTLYILDEMRSLIRVLVQFNYDKKAKELQHTYDSFLSLID